MRASRVSGPTSRSRDAGAYAEQVGTLPNMGSRLATLAICAVLGSGTVAGCGGSSSTGIASKSANQIVTAASSAMTHASSVHVSGSIVTGGVPLTLDLTVASGKGGLGQMSEGGLAFKIVNVGQTVYLQGTPEFWQHYGGAAVARLLNGKWLKAPANGQFASIAALTDMQRLVGSILLTQGVLTKGSTTTVNGHPVIAVTDKAKNGTLYVATTGPPYPIEITRAGTGGGRITFDRFNQPVTLTPPSNAIPLSQLG